MQLSNPSKNIIVLVLCLLVNLLAGIITSLYRDYKKEKLQLKTKNKIGFRMVKQRETGFETNREIAKKPKAGKFWCWRCDAQLVGEWKKCSNCGFRNGIKRDKK